MTVDPNVFELAASFADDVLGDAGVTVTPEQRATYRWRVADAMQRAVEDACSAIAAELLEASHERN